MQQNSGSGGGANSPFGPQASENAAYQTHRLQDRVSFRYFIRCGCAASSPKRFWRSSS